MSAIFDELDVPHDAQEVDVLTFFYKEKGGECRVCEKTMQMNSHFNPIFRLFFDDENLYLANLDGKYTFPRVSLRGIRRVNKRIRLESWNKEEPCNLHPRARPRRRALGDILPVLRAARLRARHRPDGGRIKRTSCRISCEIKGLPAGQAFYL